jgi:uncharacterized membrane protein YkoI
MNKSFYLAIAALSLTIGSAEEVQFSQLPAAAQKTINKNLSGGIVQEVDRKSEAGRTVYDVEVRREGKNRHLRVDADGKLLAASKVGTVSADADVDVDDGGVFDKNDGKILGIIDNPNDDDAGFDAEANVGDAGVQVEANVDGPGDRDVSEDVLDKNDGKILNVLPAPSRKNNRVDADVDLDTDKKIEGEVDFDTENDKNLTAEVDVDTDDNIEVDAEAGDGKEIFRKGDGKILGIPIPGRNDKDAEVAVEVDSNKDHVTTDADGGLDTDKNDGRILGVPKRGFETLNLAEVPPVVRQTIQREAGGYRIAEIEKATLDGRQVYEVDIERDGVNRELHVAVDGTIVKDTDREAVGAPATVERGTDRK